MTLTQNRSYVEERNGGVYITGTRISLDSVANTYQQGFSAEQISEEERRRRVVLRVRYPGDAGYQQPVKCSMLASCDSRLALRTIIVRTERVQLPLDSGSEESTTLPSLL